MSETHEPQNVVATMMAIRDQLSAVPSDTEALADEPSDLDLLDAILEAIEDANGWGVDDRPLQQAKRNVRALFVRRAAQALRNQK